MLILFTIWYVFGVADTGCSFLYVVPLSGALLKQAWWWQKSLSTCLFTKDFIFPSLMKFSLDGYEILGWQFFSLRMLNIGPTLFWLVGFLLRDLLWVWWASLCGEPDLCVCLPLAFSSSFQPWWMWWLCALGLLFLRNIFVVVSVFPGLEYWPTLLGWGSFPGWYPEEYFPGWIHSLQHIQVHLSNVD